MEGWDWLLLSATPPTGITTSMLTFKRGPDFVKLVVEHNFQPVCKVWGTLVISCVPHSLPWGKLTWAQAGSTAQRQSPPCREKLSFHLLIGCLLFFSYFTCFLNLQMMPVTSLLSLYKWPHWSFSVFTAQVGLRVKEKAYVMAIGNYCGF